MRNLSEKKMNSIFKGKRILVTGGTGSIGSEIVRQLLKFNPKQIRIYSRDESKHFFLMQELKEQTVTRHLIGDIRDKDRLELATKNTDIIFHVAALKHVSFCEYNPFEAIKTNILGTQNLIDSAIKHNVKKVIAISTDKAVYPNTIMGITKLLMERMIISAHNYAGNAVTKFSVLRFGNVLNSRGSVIPLWAEQIKNGGPVTITDRKMKRFFMSIPEAVQLIFTAASIMRGQEIIVLKMREKSITSLAKKIIKEQSNGRKIPIKIIGLGEREKLTERLFTDEELKFMINKKSFQIILPNKNLFLKRKYAY
jgi:FlaA1/EpsC-like NDP-sugar epimerase